jgi:hypothetical protein
MKRNLSILPSTPIRWPLRGRRCHMLVLFIKYRTFAYRIGSISNGPPDGLSDIAYRNFFYQLGDAVKYIYYNMFTFECIRSDTNNILELCTQDILTARWVSGVALLSLIGSVLIHVTAYQHQTKISLDDMWHPTNKHYTTKVNDNNSNGTQAQALGRKQWSGIRRRNRQTFGFRVWFIIGDPAY